MNISLVVYSLTIKKKRTVQKLKLDDVIGSDGDRFLDVLRMELGNLSLKARAYGDKRIRLNEIDDVGLQSGDYNDVFGMLKYGFHGDKSEIEDDRGTLLFEKERNHTDFIQMFFAAMLDPDRVDNYLIFSTYKKAGIKTVFSKFIQEKVGSKFEEYTIQILPYWPRQMIDMYKTGNVEYVTFKSRKPLRDAADIRFDSEGDQEFEVITTIKKVRPKKGERRARFGFNMRENIKIQDLTSDESVYSASIGVKHKGHVRGIRVGSYGGHAPAHDVNFHPKRDFDDDGNVKFQAYKREAEALFDLWDL